MVVWMGVGGMRDLEEVDDSGCGLKSRGLADLLAQKSGGKERTEDHSDF